MMKMRLLEVLSFLLVAACFSTPVDVEARAFLKRRDASNLCSRSTPCGWEVYRPFMRNVEYFIKSPCDCQGGTSCVRVSDDISISAYVYLCRPTNEDIIAWPHDSNNEADSGPTF